VASSIFQNTKGTLWTHSTLVTGNAIVQLEELGKLKNPVTSSGIKPVTFWFVA
jgi:hypothetical protein